MRDDSGAVAIIVLFLALCASIMFGIKSCEQFDGGLGQDCYPNNTCDKSYVCHRKSDYERGRCVPEHPEVR